MAMECSVTVSMGDERNGVLIEILFVIGVSRVTAEAGKPTLVCKFTRYPTMVEVSCTDVAGKDEEVIVSEAAIVL